MIVSLSLILYDTGLRLRCQQIATHCNSLGCRSCVRVAYDCERHTTLDESYTASQARYVLVALRLTGLVGLAETQDSYYNQDVKGENATHHRRILDFINLCYFLRRSTSPILKDPSSCSTTSGVITVSFCL